jgi:hypothetical protein
MLTQITSLWPAIAERKENDVSAGSVDAVVAGGKDLQLGLRQRSERSGRVICLAR